MNRNLVGSIYGMSSMKIAHFGLIDQQTWPPHAILVSDCSISKKSSPLKLLSHMNQNLVGSIYMYGRFCIKFPQSRMRGERQRLSSLSLQLNFFSETFDQMNRSLVGNIFRRSSVPIAHFDPIRLQTWLQQTILVSVLVISKGNFSSATAEPNKPNIGRNNLWKVVY